MQFRQLPVQYSTVYGDPHLVYNNGWVVPAHPKPAYVWSLLVATLGSIDHN